MNAESIVALHAVDEAIDGRGALSSNGRNIPTMTAVPAEQGIPEQRAGFDATVAQCRDELLDYMRRRLRDQDTAADLAQETLSRMMKYRDDPAVEDRRLMLFRIANNLLAEHWRYRHRNHVSNHVALDDAGPLLAENPSAEALVDARQAIDLLLNHTIVGLPPKCRTAFMLNRFDELSYAQVAAKMHISVKMVEKHITRALLACRAAVGDRDFF